ncbi:MAG: hypothetical protein JSU04_00025 [Bdellovibrionales bacterium]|nr:hypothetical protein [Bdellovibrionales bacterium]
MSRQPYQFTNEEVLTAELMIGGGAIRLDPTEGVYLHTNETHHSVGISSVCIDENGDLEIRRFSGGAVVSLSVTPDETLTKLGVRVGVSGGGITSKVHFYNRHNERLNLNRASDYSQVATPFSNLWALYINRRTN